jgi:hypothetical protein
VTTEQDHYSLTIGEEMELPVLRTTYSRTQEAVKTGSMIVISGNPEGISYQKGQLKATETGEYTVIFRHGSTLKSGGAYYMYSQPVTISVEAEETVPAETTPVQTTPTETTPTEPTDTSDSASAFPTGLIVAVVAVVAIVSIAVVALAVWRFKSKK